MRFIADESCDFAIVRALRSVGHDVVAAAELAPSAPDEQVLLLAVKEKRLLLTEDKDFGRWVFADRQASEGVILVRYPSTARSNMGRYVLHVVNQESRRLRGAFTVIEPGRARIRTRGP